MTVKCPSCGFDNIAGSDRCDQCLHSLMERHSEMLRKTDKIQSVMMAAPISNLLSGKDLLVATKKDSILKIIKILRERKLNCVLVYERKKLVGILSNRDILLKIASDGNEDKLSQLTVGSFMTPMPEFVKGTDPIALAVNKMAMGGFRHLPVIAPEGTPLSIISIKDVMAYLSKRKKD